MLKDLNFPNLNVSVVPTYALPALRGQGLLSGVDVPKFGVRRPREARA